MQSNDQPPDFIGDDPMLTAREVAQMLSLGTARIYKMAQAGNLPSYRFGHARRFLRSEVVQALQRYKQGGHGRAPRSMSRQQAAAYRAPVIVEQRRRRRRKT